VERIVQYKSRSTSGRAFSSCGIEFVPEITRTATRYVYRFVSFIYSLPDGCSPVFPTPPYPAPSHLCRCATDSSMRWCKPPRPRAQACSAGHRHHPEVSLLFSALWEEGDADKQGPLVGDRGRELSDRVVDDMWDPVNSFLKSHNYLTKRLSAFSQPTARSSFSTAQSPQQLFQKPQLNQIHPKYVTSAVLMVFKCPILQQ